MPLFNLLEKFNGEKPFEKIAKGGESREIRRSLRGVVEGVFIIVHQALHYLAGLDHVHACS